MLPSPLSLLGLVRHLTERERVYAVWALGPKSELTMVWGDYTDSGPDWDLDADASHVADSLQAWRHERARADERIAGHTALDGRCDGSGRSVRWNLIKLIGE